MITKKHIFKYWVREYGTIYYNGTEWKQIRLTLQVRMEYKPGNYCKYQPSISRQDTPSHVR